MPGYHRQLGVRIVGCYKGARFSVNKGYMRRLQKCLHLSVRSQQTVPTLPGSADHIEITESGHWTAKGAVCLWGLALWALN